MVRPETLSQSVPLRKDVHSIILPISSAPSTNGGTFIVWQAATVVGVSQGEVWHCQSPVSPHVTSAVTWSPAVARVGSVPLSAPPPLQPRLARARPVPPPRSETFCKARGAAPKVKLLVCRSGAPASTFVDPTVSAAVTVNDAALCPRQKASDRDDRSSYRRRRLYME